MSFLEENKSNWRGCQRKFRKLKHQGWTDLMGELDGTVMTNHIGDNMSQTEFRALE